MSYAALLCLLAARAAFAQDPAPPAAAVSASTATRSIQYGVRFGPAFSTLSSVEPFDSTVAAAAPEPTMNFGGFIVIDIAGPLAFQPEILFAAKGHRVHDKNAQPTPTGTGLRPPQADRVILLRYLEIPLLLRASRQTRADRSVYLIGGPALAIQRSAVIRDVADPGRFEDIGDQVSGNNFSLVFGAGLQYGRWLVDARITKGLRNVAVVPFPMEAKTSAFAVLLGVRL
jgi:hypothetical protein